MSKVLWSLSLVALCLGCGGGPEQSANTKGNAAPAASTARPVGTAVAAEADASGGGAAAGRAEDGPDVPLSEGPAAAEGPPAAEAVGKTGPEPAPASLAAAAEPEPAGAAAEPEPQPEKEETFPEPKVGKVGVKRLNVRVAPGRDKATLGTVLTQDAEVKAFGQATAQGDKWLRIEVPKHIPLWISAKYVDLPKGEALPATGTVNANKVRLRASGNFKSSVLTMLVKDTQMEVSEKVGDWLKVKAPAGVYAWVFATHIKLGVGGPVVVEPPVKTEDPAKVPVVKGPGVEVFAQAEDAYRRALAEKTPDLVPVYALYRQAFMTEGLPEMVKVTCRARMDEINLRMPEAQKKLLKAKVRSELQKELDKIEARRRAAIALLPRIAPKYVAKGFLDKAPDVAGIPGTHKLALSGVLLYYLRAVGSGVNLDKMVGRRVGVMGRKRFVKGWGIQVIDVIEIGEVGEPPTSKARFEPLGEK